LVYNFPIYRLDHFSSKIWRKTVSNRAKQKFRQADTRHTRDVARATPSRRAEPPAWCAHAEARLQPPVRARCLSHCVLVRSTRPKALGQCHVLLPHALDGGTASRLVRRPPCVAAHPAIPRPYHDPTMTTRLGVQGSTQPPRARL
jgi:hypothetical protein